MKKRSEKITVIFDFKNVNSFSFFSGDMKKFLNIGMKISKEYFPETSKRIIIINAPSMFGMLWKVIKVFLDEDTINKV